MLLEAVAARLRLSPIRSVSTARYPAGIKQWWTLSALRKTLQAAAAAGQIDMKPSLQGVAADIASGAQDRCHRLSL